MRALGGLSPWLILLAVLFSTTYGLFADQAGKFDWNRKLLGCAKHVLFDKSASGKADQLLVSSIDNVIGSINANSGSIKWRHFQESKESTSNPVIVQRSLVNAAQEGKIMRAWDKSTGQMKWEVPLSSTPTSSVLLAGGKSSVFVVASKTLFNIALSNGETLWKLELDDAKWASIGTLPDGEVLLLAADAKNTSGLVVSSMGTIEKSIMITLTHDSASCAFLKEYGVFACYGSTGVNFVDLQKSEIVAAHTANNVNSVAALDKNGPIIVADVDGTTLIQIKKKKVEVLQKLKGATAFAVSDAGHVITASSASVVTVYEPQTYKKFSEVNVRRMGSAVVTQMIPLTTTSQAVEVLIISEDCQMDMISVGLKTKAQGEVAPEWTRYEALAYISSVEMIDLPLSEAEANIETEFSMSDGNAWHAFTQRIISQFDQLRRMATDVANEFIAIINSSNLKSFSDILATLKGKNAVYSIGSFERDYFNMRKLIVATTLKGAAYGIDNSNGSVRWVLNIGSDFAPLVSSVTGEQRVPLLMQRGTAHYKFASQAVIAMNSRFSGKGRLTFFNPITGVVVDEVTLEGRLRRAELLPFQDDEMIHPIVAFGEGAEIVIVPTVTAVPDSAKHVHMMWVEENGRIYGTRLDILSKQVIPTWQSDMGLSNDERIISVSGKSPTQKVHSQGRVLGDRSVLYKYSNPNLVALAAVDDVHSVLSISLIDAVTGQVVYISRHPKGTEPFTMVHCENWLAYTYWNERGRRMDLGVMEIFDGQEQVDSERFNSLTPRKNLPVIIEQAYVFSQGISAMGVTDTEKGLTTRSLLIAMPFGGLFEVSRRFVDARRPIEMTPEMREEMLIPYMPEILIATEDMINYDQSVHNVRSIKTVPSGLESTSLVFAYGSDLFYTRTTPSGTFDILKDDFDHLFICAVLIASVVGSILLRRLARISSLKQSWA